MKIPISTNKKSILFVDDEQKVLDGLRRILYSYRDKWDMMFATNGNEALQIMADMRFDIIISDMRMPKMDGASLLRIVQERYPHIIRFILSGYGDKEMILKTVGVTDQFITKPCSAVTLIKTIEGALNAQDLLREKKYLTSVSRMKSIPTLPDLFLKLRELLESPNSSFKEIAELVKKDVAISAKVLQIVNSAFFGLKHHVDNVQHALTYLGIETLKAVVLTTDIFSQFNEEQVEVFSIRKIYQHSMIVSALARKISETVTEDRVFIDEVSMAGMLHDIGKIMLIHNKTDEYQDIYQKRRERGIPLFRLEKESLNVTHADLGGYLMTLWGLPDSIVKAITFHHNPLDIQHSVFNAITGIYVANVIVNETEEDSENEERLELDEEYLNNLKILENVSDWRKLCFEIRKKMGGADEIF